jgi:hypothetical protein
MRSPALVAFVLVLHAGCSSAVAEPSSTSAAPSPPPPTVSAEPSASEAGVEPTPVPNLQTGVVSENGLFRASWQSRPEAPAINEVHEWVLHIETAAGEPAAGALLTVDGDMPAHRHGMPTEPQVTADLGNGDYLVEGMSFQMGGYWIVDVTVTYDGETDLVRFGLEL